METERESLFFEKTVETQFSEIKMLFVSKLTERKYKAVPTFISIEELGCILDRLLALYRIFFSTEHRSLVRLAVIEFGSSPRHLDVIE